MPPLLYLCPGGQSGREEFLRSLGDALSEPIRLTEKVLGHAVCRTQALIGLSLIGESTELDHPTDVTCSVGLRLRGACSNNLNGDLALGQWHPILLIKVEVQIRGDGGGGHPLQFLPDGLAEVVVSVVQRAEVR